MSVSLKNMFFPILRSAVCGYELTGAEREAVKSAEMEKLVGLAELHGLSHLFAYGLEKNGLADAESKNEIFKAAFLCEQQNYELEKLCSVLEEAAIPFIPLKGSIIRKHYPEPWMRNSCDIDVLVHEKDLNTASDALSSALGYTAGERWTHDIPLTSPSGVHIELHFDLIEDYRVSSAHSVLTEIWSYTSPEEGTEYRLVMNDAAFYFYHIAHMAKHFENGGCGIRPFLDLWILENRLEYDRAERNALLEKGGLTVFADNCRKLCAYWFGGGEADALTLQMEDFVLRGGVYGSVENWFDVQQSKKGGRFKYVFSRMFPAFKEMHPRYPVLKKCPMLLPVFWVYRAIRMVASGGMKRTARELELVSSAAEAQSNVSDPFIKRIGL